MGIIKRPDKVVKLEDADTPVENEVVCIVEKNSHGEYVEVICMPEESLKEPMSGIKSKAVITSSSTGEQYGNWIPTLRSSGTIDISIRNAFYTKVGQLVVCTFDIVVTNMLGGKKESPVMLTGIPVNTTGSPNAVGGSVFIPYFKTSNLDVRQITGTINGNDNRIDLWCDKRGPGGLVPLTQIDINTNTVLAGTITYISIT